MKGIAKRSLVTPFAALAVAVTAFVSATSAVAQPDPRPGATQPVQIMGPLPVPVTSTVSGTVSVSGSVAITNTPLPVTGTVGLTSGNSVTIANTATNPVPVRNMDEPRQPVEGQCNVPGGQRTTICNIFSVPAGKRLVVELISYNLSGSTIVGEGNPVEIWFGDSEVMNCGNCAGRYFLPPVFAGTLGALRVYTDMRQTRLYLDQGKALGARVTWDQNNPLGGNFTFSGFLVNR